MYKDNMFFKNIDLDKESEYIIDNNSIKVIYIYKDVNTRCKCYNQLHKTGDKKCKLCNGDGFAKVAKIIDVFIDESNMATNITGDIKDVAGEAHVGSVLMFTKSNNKIIEDSYIVVVGFINGLPYDVHKVYYCSDVLSPRATNGEIKFVSMKCKLTPQAVKSQDTLIKRMSIKDKKSLMSGGIYKWMV